MARFTSILFPNGGAPEAVEAAPDCFADLHLDEIIAAVTAGHPTDVDRFFYVPLHDVSTVEHRHQVFRDLESDQTRQAVMNFAHGMQTMRHRLQQAKRCRIRCDGTAGSSMPSKRSATLWHCYETISLLSS